MLVPPLRIPVRTDLSELLGVWLDAVNQGAQENTTNEKDPPDFATGECREDLKQLHLLRCRLGDDLMEHVQQQNSRDNKAEIVALLEDYYACLLVFEEKGFPSITGLTTGLEWNSADTAKIRHKGLSWERASVLWNLASLEAYAATKQDKTTTKGWNLAFKGFQSAYSYMHHLKNQLSEGNSENDFDFHDRILQFWERTLLAQAQMSGYEMSASKRRPQHKVLSQLAAATAPLWNEAEEAIAAALQQQQQQRTPQQQHFFASRGQQQEEKWKRYAQAWSSFMKCKTEYHEACTPNIDEKEKFARLELSLRYGNDCMGVYELYETSELTEERFGRDLPPFLEKVREMYDEAFSNGGGGGGVEELREIRGTLLSKGPADLSKNMLEWNSEATDSSSNSRPPLFANLMGPEGRSTIAKFKRDMEQFVSQVSTMVDEKTELARKELAKANLPHSLTAYKQEQSGGGIPVDLWNRVDKIQRSNRLSGLKRDLWNLRDIADQAQHIFQQIEKDLQDDVDMDSLFRQQNGDFRGTDVQQIQRSFRQSLSNYKKLLLKSQDGDSILLKRLERLDQDPKFRLLQFGKAQLDVLLPPGGNDDDKDPSRKAAAMIDTTPLSRLLVDLSNIFHNRDMSVETLKKMIQDYDIQPAVAQIDPASPTALQQYESAVQEAQSKAFSGMAHEIQHNLKTQDALMRQIMELNQRFMEARRKKKQQSRVAASSGNANTSSDSCIAMIEDALDEIDTLTKHLSEGKDFYNVVIPKLSQLKNQVTDASARLTADRCEFEDSYNVNRQRQEEEDARMAASLMQQNNSSSNNNNNNNTPSTTSSSSQPVQQQQSQPPSHHHQQQHNQPPVSSSPTPQRQMHNNNFPAEPPQRQMHNNNFPAEMEQAVVHTSSGGGGSSTGGGFHQHQQHNPSPPSPPPQEGQPFQRRSYTSFDGGNQFNNPGNQPSSFDGGNQFNNPGNQFGSSSNGGGNQIHNPSNQFSSSNGGGYNDNNNRHQFNNNSGGSHTDHPPNSQHSHPGVVNVSHDEPQVRVDDEKVASLVAMDFDPDKVVNALRKYDNNVEQALNDLLSG